jgi:aromatic-L-amino-acid decarboxylase
VTSRCTVPFAVSALLVADPAAHRETFATQASYLDVSRALAGGPDWATNCGLALSRPFHGLARYLILRARGLRAIGEGIAHCVVLAQYFADLVMRSPLLDVVAPVVGNVILFEARHPDGEAIDADELAAVLQERGETVFSTTRRGARKVLRACFVNHNTRTKHVEAAVRQLEAALSRSRPQARGMA